MKNLFDLLESEECDMDHEELKIAIDSLSSIGALEKHVANDGHITYKASKIGKLIYSHIDSPINDRN